jgi:hypothetical protein
MKFPRFSIRLFILCGSLLTLLGAKETTFLVQAQDCNDIIDGSVGECLHEISSPFPNSLRKASTDFETTLSLNRKVYNYAIAHLGQQIADGECAFLIHNALVAAGARTSEHFGSSGLNADYVWGKLIATITPKNIDIQGVEMGDIIQFRDVSTYEKITKPDGSWKTRKVQYTHHTSIIGEINGNQLVLIHQNFGNDPAIKKTVQKSDLNLDSLRSGTLWIYRPTQ